MCLALSKEHYKTSLAEYYGRWGADGGGGGGAEGGGGAVHGRSSYLLDYQLVERPTKKPRRNTDAGSGPRWGKGFFSLSQLPVQTLLQCPYSLRVQLHASTSVRTFNKKKKYQ